MNEGFQIALNGIQYAKDETLRTEVDKILQVYTLEDQILAIQQRFHLRVKDVSKIKSAIPSTLSKKPTFPKKALTKLISIGKKKEDTEHTLQELILKNFDMPNSIPLYLKIAETSLNNKMIDLALYNSTEAYNLARYMERDKTIKQGRVDQTLINLIISAYCSYAESKFMQIKKEFPKYQEINEDKKQEVDGRLKSLQSLLSNLANRYDKNSDLIQKISSNITTYKIEDQDVRGQYAEASIEQATEKREKDRESTRAEMDRRPAKSEEKREVPDAAMNVLERRREIKNSPYEIFQQYIEAEDIYAAIEQSKKLDTEAEQLLAKARIQNLRAENGVLGAIADAEDFLYLALDAIGAHDENVLREAYQLSKELKPEIKARVELEIMYKNKDLAKELGIK